MWRRDAVHSADMERTRLINRDRQNMSLRLFACLLFVVVIEVLVLFQFSLHHNNSQTEGK